MYFLLDIHPFVDYNRVTIPRMEKVRMATEQEIRDIAKKEIVKLKQQQEPDGNFLWGVIVGAVLYWLLTTEYVI